ncbi:trans-sulfuration enzyme family protein [Planctomicrobium sp. SH668]|uniref:trans-sulfuration enzyme family protein n=1 Tax=Planctomicrobium sp. SH668 TaxID=3448126 RepID=UPI003F5BA569
MHFQTRCVHTGVDKDKTFNSCTTPIYTSSTFYWDDLKTHRGFDYTRSGNPTRAALEENLAALEGGISCRATSTGMSAVLAALQLFKPGDHIITGHDIYGGTYRLFANILTEQGYKFSFVDMGDAENVRQAITPETKAIWIETPSNPLLNIVDIASIVAVAKSANLVTLADNTFLSPYLQRPFELGVDVVVHSTTKYLNGHSDVVGGAVITRTQEHADKVAYYVNAMGLACSPFDAWLVLRGVKTLPVRMEAHQRGAIAVAQALEKHPKVDRVYFPGLESHPHHELAKKQQKGFGAMVSFDLKGGRPAVEAMLKKIKMFLLAESLGGVESLIEFPDTMSHASMTQEARRTAGISESTVRLSVGIEHPEDLVADLLQAIG